jgi:hypothetical protein
MRQGHANNPQLLRLRLMTARPCWGHLPALRAGRRLLAAQHCHDLLEGLIGDRLDLGPGAVLDRVRDIDNCRLETQRIALRFDTFDEAGGDDVDAGQAAAVEAIEVVQTARCAGPSIA